jgi:superfamily I DNA/RNA helicase
LQPGELGEVNKLLVSVALQNLRDDYLLEEFSWIIEGQNCTSLADYLQAQRAGRGIPFGEQLRKAVWELYTAYRRYLAEQGQLTWDQLRQLALAEVQSDNFKQRWDYVIVDEAQDLPPTALALCVALCRDPAGLFLTADANQSLYNRGFRWQNVHEQLKVQGRTRILRRNYRSTKEIAAAAIEFLAKTPETDVEAMQQTFVHLGPPPVVYAAEGTADQARWLAEQIRRAIQDLHLPINAAAVLVPSNNLGQSFAKLLTEQGLPASYLSGRDIRLEERSVKVLTLHSAKGLEFPIVALAHFEADRVPKDNEATDALDLQEHYNAQRRLVYVGCTRAMRYLFVTHDRSLPSPFLEQLSEDCWLWL